MRGDNGCVCVCVRACVIERRVGVKKEQQTRNETKGGYFLSTRSRYRRERLAASTVYALHMQISYSWYGINCFRLLALHQQVTAEKRNKNFETSKRIHKNRQQKTFGAFAQTCAAFSAVSHMLRSFIVYANSSTLRNQCNDTLRFDDEICPTSTMIVLVFFRVD